MKWWTVLLVSVVFGLTGSVRGNEATMTPPVNHADSSSTTQPAGKFPTPAELMAKIQAAQKKDGDDDLPKVAYFDLSDGVTEKPADFNFFGGDQIGVTLRVLIDRLEKARQDVT